MAESNRTSVPGPVVPAQAPPRTKKPKRPAFALIVILTVVLRVGREILPWWLALVATGGLLVAMVIWRLVVRYRARRNAGSERTPGRLRQQIADAGVAPPAFEEDGTLLGASVLVVNQRTKLVEVISEYEIFGVDGITLGHVRQIAQGKFKQILRFVGPWDQFFTHHFDVADRNGVLVLRLTRPRKLFKSRLEVFDGNDRFMGRLIQQNVFGKIRFAIHDPNGTTLGMLLAENWRAWDFHVALSNGVEVASITKSWEGTMRTVFTNADHYVIRVHEKLDEPLRSIVMAAALTVDLALKQDRRGIA